MGKIRMKTIGDEELEKKQAVDAKKRQEAKKVKKTDDEALNDTAQTTPTVQPDKSDEGKEARKSPQRSQHRHTGRKYKAAKQAVGKQAQYSLKDGVKLIKSVATARFDEAVEVHVNLRETAVKGEVLLPHGSGKEVKVAVVDGALLKRIEAGTIDFDILIATPADMPQLVKFARVLGPKGLMPNPKNGTVTEKPEEAVKKFAGGTVRYQSEAKFPILHQAVGKTSFTEDQLIKNISVLTDALKKKNIVSLYLASTMSPSVSIDVESL